MLFLVADFGTTCAFQIIYVAHTSVFPTLFAGTSFGFCNFVSRLAASLSPLISMIPEPIPMIIYKFIFVAIFVMTLFLKTERSDIDDVISQN